jgi:hypothetical protein
MMRILTYLFVGIFLSALYAPSLHAQANINDIGRFTRVWDGGIAGADNPSNPNGVKNMVRSWELEAGFDLDNDGLREFAAYDANNKVYFIWENTARGVNDYQVVYTLPAPAPLYGGERSIMITDMDHDGNKEFVVVWDSFHPDSTDGFNAVQVFEHDPGSGEFLPSTPQLTYDPPRNSEPAGRGPRVALEMQSLAGDFDFDGNTELVLTYRSAKDMLIAVLEFEGDDISTGSFNVEFVDRGGPDGGGSTPTDSTAWINRVHGFASGDLNNDGRPDFVLIPDTQPVEVRVYSTSGPDQWQMWVFDETKLPATYVTAKGSNATPGIGDFNGDGYNEVYIIGRGKVAEDPTNVPRLWVVSPAGGGPFDLATAFNAENFTDLEVGEIVPPTEQNKDDLRGGFVGDGDNDGNLEVYILSRDLTTVFATEWVGDPGGDVTDPFNYQTTALYNSKTDHPDLNIQFSNIKVGDFDGDGPNHMDVVFTSPNGEQEGLGPSIFVLGYDATDTEIPDLEINNFTRVWDGGIAGADNPSNPNGVKNMVRSWELEAGFDLDNDGLREFAAYDANNKVYFIWENTARGVNDYQVVYTLPAPAPLYGGERSIMITDMDHDGNKEFVVVWDSFHPDSTDGFNAVQVFEHDPGSGEFLPSTPQLTYDPPRNSEPAGRGPRVALEMQSLAGDFDFDGNTELVLTYRSAKDMLIAVLEFEGDDISTGSFNVEFVDRGGPDGGGSTPTDSTAWINRVHGFASGDLNNDGRPDFVLIPDTQPVEVRVYSTSGPDQWQMWVFDETKLPATYVTAKGSNATPGIGDFNGDGYNEVYIIGRGKVAEDPTNVPRLWVVSPAGGGPFDLATAFNAENFTDLEVGEIVPPTEQNKDDLRGGFVGDGDNDGNLEVYILSRDLTTVFATEWVGDPGGDVTDPFNYQTTALYNSKTDHPDLNIQFSNIKVGDFDFDGPNHTDAVFTSPNGEQEGLGPSIFVMEFNESDVPVTSVAFRTPSDIPKTYALRQNFPNPFNPETRITYELPVGAKVRLEIYNVLGQKVRTLVQGDQPIGVHQVVWDGTNDAGAKVGSGVYLYVLKAGTFVESKKMLLLK